MNLLILITTTILFFSLKASANSSQRLIDELNKRVTVLPSKIYAFHYENDWEGVISKFKPRDHIRHLRDQATRFSDAEIYSDFAGPGLYAAIDPISSQAFGGRSNWVLYVIGLERGARILDLDNYLVPEEFRDLLVAHGCIYESTPMADMGSMEFMRTSRSWLCRKFFIQILHEMGVDAIAYSYITAPAPGLCNSLPKVAYNIIRPQALREGNLIVFTSRTQPKGETEKTAAILGRYMSRILPAYSYLNDYTTELKRLSPKSTEEEAKVWAEKYIFKCDNSKEPEHSLEFIKVPEEGSIGARYWRNERDSYGYV